MKHNDTKEPNPTLYIIKLKKIEFRPLFLPQNMTDNLIRLLYKVLKLYGVPITKRTIEETLLTHPDYPSPNGYRHYQKRKYGV